MNTVCRDDRVARSALRAPCRIQPCVYSLQCPVQLLTLGNFLEVMAALHSNDSMVSDGLATIGESAKFVRHQGL